MKNKNKRTHATFILVARLQLYKDKKHKHAEESALSGIDGLFIKMHEWPKCHLFAAEAAIADPGFLIVHIFPFTFGAVPLFKPWAS